MKQKTQSEVTVPASKPEKGDVYGEFDAEIYTLYGSKNGAANPHCILGTFTDYAEMDNYCQKHNLTLISTTGLDDEEETQSEVTVNESKHTPGPWNYGYVRNDNNVCPVPYYEIGAGHSMFWTALVNASERVTEPKEAEANARLIAAAPDMLEALKEIKFKTECGNLTTMAMGTIGDICVKAIAKATNSK